MRSAIILFLLAPTATGATFQGTTGIFFEIRETIGSVTTTESTTAQVPVVLDTDYSSIDWRLDFTNQSITMAGSPNEPFETILEVDGMLSMGGSMPLSFPNAQGTAIAGAGMLSGTSITYAVTDRIVTATQRHESLPVDVMINRNYEVSFNVADYPANVDLLLRGGDSGLHSLGTVSTGVNSFIEAFLELRATGSQLREIVLTEVLPGDFNSSRSVDAGDFTTWKDGAGLLAPLMTSYETWEDNFGNTAANESASAVPEVSAAALLVLGLFGQLLFMRRHHCLPRACSGVF